MFVIYVETAKKYIYHRFLNIVYHNVEAGTLILCWWRSIFDQSRFDIH